MSLRPSGYYLERAAQYQADVLAGRLPACRWVRLACERQARDLKAAKKKTASLIWDGAAAERVCASVEHFPHIKGPKAKLLRSWVNGRQVARWQTLELEPWQCWKLTTFFGWKRATGFRRYRTGLILVPRKNAKSTLTAAVGNYLLTADGEGGPEIYSAATKKDQARIVFSVAQEMARRSPQFRHYFGVLVLASKITVESTAGFFEALSSDEHGLEGLNPHGALVDELAAHRTRAVWDVIETAMGARDQPVLWGISTAGPSIGGICHELCQYGEKVLEGTVDDDSFFYLCYTIDEADREHWNQERVWRKANPNYGVSVTAQYLEDKARKAQHTPAAQTTFLIKHLNVWVTAAAPWMSMTDWAACATPGLTWADLHGAVKCVVTVDLAEKRDIASIVAIAEMPDGVVRVVAKHFLPEVALEASPIAQLAGWARDGWIVKTEGDVHDYTRLEEAIVEIYHAAQATEIGFDRALAVHLMQNLQARLGQDVIIEVPQNIKTFNPAMKDVAGLVVARQFEHPADPALTWMVSNVAERRNHMEESYPQKAGGKDSPNKIDGAIAVLMGRARLLVVPETSGFDGLVVAG